MNGKLNGWNSHDTGYSLYYHYGICVLPRGWIGKYDIGFITLLIIIMYHYTASLSVLSCIVIRVSRFIIIIIGLHRRVHYVFFYHHVSPFMLSKYYSFIKMHKNIADNIHSQLIRNEQKQL